MLYARVLLFMLLPPVVLFGSAGRLDLPFFWAYVALLAGAAVGVLFLVDRDLLKERVQPAPGGTDRNLRMLAMPVMLGHWIIAGIDVGRYHFSDSIPFTLRVAGLVVLAFSFSLSLWAMHVNRFFSPVVRIQEERGHHLITTGPYRWIRHPGYLAAMLHVVGTLSLGSWAAMLPMLPVIALVARRAVIEDRFLHEKLEGYGAYAARVRYRIVPGIW